MKVVKPTNGLEVRSTDHWHHVFPITRAAHPTSPRPILLSTAYIGDRVTFRISLGHSVINSPAFRDAVEGGTDGGAVPLA